MNDHDELSLSSFTTHSVLNIGSCPEFWAISNNNEKRTYFLQKDWPDDGKKIDSLDKMNQEKTIE